MAPPHTRSASLVLRFCLTGRRAWRDVASPQLLPGTSSPGHEAAPGGRRCTPATPPWCLATGSPGYDAEPGRCRSMPATLGRYQQRLPGAPHKLCQLAAFGHPHRLRYPPHPTHTISLLPRIFPLPILHPLSLSSLCSSSASRSAWRALGEEEEGLFVVDLCFPLPQSDWNVTSAGTLWDFLAMCKMNSYHWRQCSPARNGIKNIDKIKDSNMHPSN